MYSVAQHDLGGENKVNVIQAY